MYLSIVFKRDRILQVIVMKETFLKNQTRFILQQKLFENISNATKESNA